MEVLAEIKVPYSLLGLGPSSCLNNELLLTGYYLSNGLELTRLWLIRCSVETG
jgi:hypothetical protein